MHMQNIHQGRSLFGDGSHAFYKTILPLLKPGLMLDLGANIGGYTQMMRRLSPGSRVISYEPFPANLPHFLRLNGNEAMVTLRKVAVSDYAGASNFFVSSTVKEGTTGFWGDYVGSSSVGALVPNPTDKTITVDTVMLDDEIDERVTFMKMDVQGAEGSVLRGARKLIRHHGIDIMTLEVSSEDNDCLKTLVSIGYVLFDTPYSIILRSDSDLSDWDVIGPQNLSTGHASVTAFPKFTPKTPDAVVSFLKRQDVKAGKCWTDFVAVAPIAKHMFGC